MNNCEGNSSSQAPIEYSRSDLSLPAPPRFRRWRSSVAGLGSKWTGNLIAPQSVRAISIRSERPRIWDTKCPMPTHVNDVAAFILRERGAMTAMKLQKLVYYSQAWVLVWDERQLFPR